MPLKQKLDKDAWAWADSVDPSQVTFDHVKQAYRLNLKPCEKGACKRNCKGNPFCLNNLGEKKWFSEIDETKWQNFDPESERRQEGHFVGLKNLGATCYVNTFLQLLFHSPNVRQAVYKWREFDTPEEYYEGWKPTSICGNLQVIFALLQYSNRCYIDPTPLIESIGLDAGEQQDAQEFSKLFLHVLESALSGDGTMEENVIQKQFSGSYRYVTVCQNCGSQSETPATFYELDLNIRGHSTLSSSIKDFLQEEKLEGDNQYMCNVCNSKQNATRAIRLDKLPPVLNLQLLRFVFDKNKGHKKKLSSFIQFSETLDMSPYMGLKEGEGVIYELAAVLIHRGPTAHSGHYIAHIRELESGNWYMYNDEEIEKMKNRKLELGKEDDILAENSNEKAPKSSKGHHSSRNAYMLVYRKKEEGTPGDRKGDEKAEKLVPAAVKGYVENDNKEFEKWIQEMLEKQDENINEVKQTREEMKSLYHSLPVNTLDEPWEWVSTDWLTKWLADPTKLDKVVNNYSKCPHDKLVADDVVKLKCISGHGAELLFTKYPVNERYKGESLLCEACVRRKCKERQFRRCMTDDDALFSTKSFPVTEEDEYYWVSTKHLRRWKNFAVEEIPSHLVNSPTPSPAKTAIQVLDVSTSSDQGMTPDKRCSVTPDTKTESSLTEAKVQNFIACSNSLASASTSYVTATSASSSPSSSGLVESFQISPSSSSPSMSTPCSTSHELLSISTKPSKRSKTDADINLVNNNCLDLPTDSPSPCKRSKIDNEPNSDNSSSAELNPEANHFTTSPSSTCITSDVAPSRTPSKDEEFSTNLVGQEEGASEHSCSSPDSEVVVFKDRVEEFNDSVSEASEDRSLQGNTSEPGVEGDSGVYNSQTPETSFNGSIDGSSAHRNGTSECSNMEDDEEKTERFNDDILCEHGNLRVDESGRKAVPKYVWDRLLHYFPYLKPFTFGSSVCNLCLAQQKFEQQMKLSRKQLGQGQKDALNNLYSNNNRPKINEDWHGRTAFLVSSSFVEAWRKFIKHSKNTEGVKEIVNAPLLCEHKLMLYKPEDLNESDSSTRFLLVWKEEWDKLTGYFSYDAEVEVIQIKEEALNRYTLVTRPEVCETCLEERVRQEEEGRFVFSGQPVYVRKIVDGVGMDGDLKGDDSNGKGKGYNYDPEFNAPPHQRMGRGRGVGRPPTKHLKQEGSGHRKSSRHRKTRGEKEVMASSSMTLKEFKIKIFNELSVPPFDQNLSLDGRCLVDDSATLQSLRVYPQCVIMLKADEPSGESTTTVDDYLSVPTGPEEGFKGTNLLGR